MKNKDFSSISITEFAKSNSGSTILSIGDPHFGTSKEVIIESYNMLMTGTTHYSNMKGLIELRNAILEGFDYATYNSDNVLITPGSKQGIYYILKTLKKIPLWLSLNLIGIVMLVWQII